MPKAIRRKDDFRHGLQCDICRASTGSKEVNASRAGIRRHPEIDDGFSQKRTAVGYAVGGQIIALPVFDAHQGNGTQGLHVQDLIQSGRAGCILQGDFQLHNVRITGIDLLDDIH